ncbi:cation:proton antiporter family protein [Rhabdochromatium marinum]|uniref:cation:proton antiporter family protein n=1 Tax=Rhabdochromatium marinum TaxID=48729 RepID=UPI00190704AF|nr:cation:proton antiporter family protein [Rhabdochromatium marinum]MBK1647094.1 potassium transporter Kef [Rhabdochromatium marinum]
MAETIAWLASAFVCGLIARQLGLPPLVGYLVAGFGLQATGAEATELIDVLSALGVTLLLFSIGLKLRLSSLVAPHVWGVASAHMLVFIAVTLPILLGLGALGLPYVSEITPAGALLVAFALSFSSTVFAVKVLEDKGEMGALYGTIAIGILVIQDLAAVLFLAASLGKTPSLWALALLALLPLRRVMLWLLEGAGHGELLLLFGVTVALGGAQVFELVHVKGDLGALLLGVLIASHPKAAELSKTLLGLKDLFLVGFFLSIGLSATPSADMLPLVLVLIALLLAKGFLFEQWLLAFRLRARTALLCGLSLASYSEFGLIVAAVAAKSGWLSADWLAIIAITLSLSLILASTLNARSHDLYELFSARLRRQERQQRIPVEREIDPGRANAMIIGMGQVGAGAYDRLVQTADMRPVGIDADPDTVARHAAGGRHVVQGSATDADFWQRLHLDDGHVKLVLLAMPRVSENQFAAEHLRQVGYTGVIGAIAKFRDDEPALRAAGVEQVFNLYAEAGAGLAQHVCATRTAVRPASGAT